MSEHVTVAEASRLLGVPAGTIRAWASAKKLHPVGLTAAHGAGSTRRRLYDLAHIRTLADNTTRRTR